MSETQEFSTDQGNAAASNTVDGQSRINRRPLRRLGCGLLLALWFMILMMPCGLFYLAANDEIRLWHSDIPQPHEHPLLLISLVSERDDRGLRLERSFVAQDYASTNEACVETNVRFVLWQSKSGDQDANYCDCYDRNDEQDEWVLESTYAGHCQAAE